MFCDGNLAREVLARALELGRETGVPVVVDAVSTAKVTRLPADLTGLTLLSCNRDEARAWLRHHGKDHDPSSDVELAQALHRAGAANVLLTRGAAGLIVIRQRREAQVGEGQCQAGEIHEIPAVPADPVDVTGAGDALIAGTVAALLRGADLIDAAKAGTERAARTVESELSVLRE